MRLKSFNAKTMSQALQMIREALGEDAIIVGSQEAKDGKSVTVTAAVESGAPAFELGKEGRANAKEWLQYDEEEETTAVTEALTDTLIKHGVPDSVSDQIISYAMVIGFQDPVTALISSCETLFDFRPLREATQKTRFLFIGPQGAGKTLTTAKFAAQAVLKGEDVAVATTDTMRAGAVEQLEAFTKIMDIDCHRISDPRQMAQFLNDTRDKDAVFIDAPGVNPYDAESLKTLAQLVAHKGLVPVLVMPSAVDPSESEEIAKIFASLGTKIMVSTRLDVSRRYGGLLAAANAGNMIFAEFGTDSAVANGFKTPSAEQFVQYVLPRSQAERSIQNTEQKRVGEK